MTQLVNRFGDHNFDLLLAPGHHTDDGSPEALPRITICGSVEAMSYGLAPILDFPDKLIVWEDVKSVITHCNDLQLFPVYHQEASGNFNLGWMQDGFGYCWSYGLSACCMDCREVEGKKPIRLAPFSLGWQVGWRNRGNSLDTALKGACERGIASSEYVPEYELDYRKFKQGWEQNALNHRPTEFYDTRRSEGEKSMILQCLTILATSRPLYIAYNWWGHALECIGMRWDETERNNIVWIIRNSHGEKKPIELVGVKGVPDEAYGVRATSFSSAV